MNRPLTINSSPNNLRQLMNILSQKYFPNHEPKKVTEKYSNIKNINDQQIINMNKTAKLKLKIPQNENKYYLNDCNQFQQTKQFKPNKFSLANEYKYQSNNNIFKMNHEQDNIIEQSSYIDHKKRLKDYSDHSKTKFQSLIYNNNVHQSINSQKNSIRRSQRNILQPESSLSQLQYYKYKCISLQQKNRQLQQKVQTFEEQFKQEKMLVQNLQNMITQRQKQIDQLISSRLKNYHVKEKYFEEIYQENQYLKNQLQEVRHVMKQQENIIVELYKSKKSKIKQPLRQSIEETYDELEQQQQ